MRWHASAMITVVLATTYGAFGTGVVEAADHRLCYTAALAKGQPKLAATPVSLTDRFAGPTPFTASKVRLFCTGADLNGSGIAQPAVHHEGFALAAPRGVPKLAKRTLVAIDAFATRTLVVGGRPALLDVTPATPADPTSDPSVNRFACYRAKTAKEPKYVPPPAPTVADELAVAGRTLVVRKVTRFCTAADRDGLTADAAMRDAALVCYAVSLPRRSPKFVRTTVATNTAGFATHALVLRKPVELCVAAVSGATPTPQPTATPVAKRVFATSTTQTGGLGGVTGADAVCATRAGAAGLAGVFRAWVSTADSSPAATFTHSDGPYQLVDGTKVADDWNDLVDGTLDHAIDRNESGGSAFGDVWTGTATSGTVAAATCNAWTTGGSGASGQCGSAQSASGAWTAASVPLCNTPLRLYCFEQ